MSTFPTTPNSFCCVFWSYSHITLSLLCLCRAHCSRNCSLPNVSFQVPNTQSYLVISNLPKAQQCKSGPLKIKLSHFPQDRLEQSWFSPEVWVNQALQPVLRVSDFLHGQKTQKQHIITAGNQSCFHGSELPLKPGCSQLLLLKAHAHLTRSLIEHFGFAICTTCQVPDGRAHLMIRLLQLVWCFWSTSDDSWGGVSRGWHSTGLVGSSFFRLKSCPSHGPRHLGVHEETSLVLMVLLKVKGFLAHFPCRFNLCRFILMVESYTLTSIVESYLLVMWDNSEVLRDFFQGLALGMNLMGHPRLDNESFWSLTTKCLAKLAVWNLLHI